MARAESRILGLPARALVFVPHPVGGLQREEVLARADGAVAHVLAALGSEPGSAAAD